MRKKPLEERFWEKVQKTEGCWLWTAGCNSEGYGIIRVPFCTSMQLAHRVAWILENGSIPDGLDVLHKCDTPPCVCVQHLFLGTQLDNIRDRQEKGRQARQRGELHGRAKLTEQQVLAIRDRYAAGGATQQQLAELYGIHQTKISAIVRGERWSHLHMEG